MPAVALTDHGSLAGAVELYREAASRASSRSIGCEVYVADDRHAQEKGYAHLTAPRRDERGLREPDQALLARLPRGLLLQAARRLGAARAAREGARRALRLPLGPRLARRSRRAGRRTRAPTSTGSRRSSAATRPTSRSRTPASSRRQRINPQLAKLAEATGLPLVATGDVHYLLHEDARAHEALLCIQSGDSLKNPNHWRFDTDQFYFKTPEEMAPTSPATRTRCARTLEVAERCNVDDRDRPASCCRSSRPRTTATRSSTSSSSARQGLHRRYETRHAGAAASASSSS